MLPGEKSGFRKSAGIEIDSVAAIVVNTFGNFGYIVCKYD